VIVENRDLAATDAEQTIAQAIAGGARSLSQAGIDSHRLDAQVMLAAVLEVPRSTVFGYPERALSTDQLISFQQMIGRRIKRQPVSQIIGSREFWGRNFRVTQDTLTPRPDSETLIDAALTYWRKTENLRTPRILDLGTGTGCLLLTLLAEISGASGVGLDICNAALDVARDNATHLGLADRAQFKKSDWCQNLPVDSRFDIVIANPPYLSDDDRQCLEPEVAVHEPARALWGGPDGLDAYRILAPQISKFLEEDGFAVLEVGAGQAPAVVQILKTANLETRSVHKDLAGIERCILAAGQ